MPNSKLPDFLVVGAAKSGTTSLFHILRNDPRCFIPNIKEGRFFSDMPRYSKGGEAARWPNVRPRDLQTYLKLYAQKSGCTKGDISPDYLYYSEKSIGRIKAYYSLLGQVEPKILIVIRNPVDRVVSAYLHIMRLGSDDKTFREAFDLSATRIEEGYSWQFDLKGFGSCSADVKRFQENFSAVKVFLFDDVFSSSSLVELAHFLELDDQLIKRGVARKNVGRAVEPRNKALFETSVGLARRIKKSLGVPENGSGREVFWGVPKKIFRMIQRVNEKPVASEISREDLQYVKSYFADDVGELEKILGVSLQRWC